MRPGEDYGGGNREEGREYGREEFRYDTIDPGERTRAQGGGGPHWGGLSVLLSLTLAAAATPPGNEIPGPAERSRGAVGVSLSQALRQSP